MLRNRRKIQRRQQAPKPVKTKPLHLTKCHSTCLTPQAQGRVPMYLSGKHSINKADYTRKATDKAFYCPTWGPCDFLYGRVSLSITPSTAPQPWRLLKPAQRNEHITKGQEKWEIKTIQWVTSSPTQATSQCHGPELIFYTTSGRITSPPQYHPGGWSENHN